MTSEELFQQGYDDGRTNTSPQSDDVTYLGGYNAGVRSRTETGE